MAHARGAYALTAPTVPVFAIALVLAVLAFAAHYAGVGIPWISGHVVETLSIAFVVLTAGVLLRGL